MPYTNSPLVVYTKLSPNNSGTRTHVIDRITPHCVVGQVSVETLGDIFAPPSRQASSNYGIGTDGRIAMYVEEKNRSWCSSDARNDQRAVTIECASDKTDPYTMNEAVYKSLVKLCADICERNGKRRLIWIPNKEMALNYDLEPDEMLLTVHRWFANKSCPGDWLYNRLSDLARQVTMLLNPPEPWEEQASPWAVDGVRWAVENEILRGDGKGDYRLRDSLTREEMCVILYRAREVL